MVNAKSEISSLRCIWGIFLLVALCPIIGMSLFSYDWHDVSILHVPTSNPPCNLIGPVGAWLAYRLFMLFGVGAYIVPLWCLVFGGALIFSRAERIWPKAAWSILFVFSYVGIMELYQASWVAHCAELNIIDTGGIFGCVVMRGVLMKWLHVGAGFIAWTALLASLIMFVGKTAMIAGFRHSVIFFRGLVERIREFLDERSDQREKIAREERQIDKRRRRLEKTMRKQERSIQSSKPVVAKDPEPEKKAKKISSLKKLITRQPQPPKEDPAKKEAPVDKQESGKEQSCQNSYELPSLDLFAPVSSKGKVSSADTETISAILVDTLAEFGIEAQVTDVQKGPVVTRYEILPAPGIRVERIAGLANNLALVLKATSVRVQAPIPGKGVVGIEVPNSTAELVGLRELLESDQWRSGDAKLPLALGKDVSGKEVIGDLAAMPHLLIAGATGSGKTICINSVLAGLLSSRTPAEMRLLLVDPKIVEFTAFNNLPHLVVPVVTNSKKVALALRWAINEMEKRYKLFAKTGVRNIVAYNSREITVQDDLFEHEEKQSGVPPPTVPYIVIVIDELADLMLADGPEIENAIARLAQLSRAVGIHMIIATQRPSVNVITGTIKANFPARIAFQVAQKVDSRTILDASGADKLLGRGDMLFLPPGSSKLIRVQGAMTSDEEILALATYIKTQGEPEYEQEIKTKIEKQAGRSIDDGGEDDEILAQAVEIIKETQRASTSSLQRRLRIGYTRAARIMDILEERGIIGPPRGSDPREILIDLDGEIPDNSQEPMEEAGETIEGNSEDNSE